MWTLFEFSRMPHWGAIACLQNAAKNAELQTNAGKAHIDLSTIMSINIQ